MKEPSMSKPESKLSAQARVRLVLELIASDASVGEVAARHGVREPDLARWHADFLRATQPRRASKGMAALAFVACLGAGVAWSQAAAFPISLITFTGNTPAVASQVNSNFSALKNASDALKTGLENKIGALGTAGVQAKSLSVSGPSTMSGGTSMSGGASISGDATVSGTFTAGGATTLNANTSISGNLSVTGEVTSAQRYVVEAAWNKSFAAQNRASSSTLVDLNRLSTLCGDRDGCTIRLVMKDWGGGAQDISAPPQHFEYQRPLFLTSFDSLNGNFATGGDYSVRDGNNVINHAMRTYNCFLTDSKYEQGAEVGSDAAEDMYLLNFNIDTRYFPTCMLIVDD
jgi:hypothetical protein